MTSLRLSLGYCMVQRNWATPYCEQMKRFWSLPSPRQAGKSLCCEGDGARQQSIRSTRGLWHPHLGTDIGQSAVITVGLAGLADLAAVEYEQV